MGKAALAAGSHALSVRRCVRNAVCAIRRRRRSPSVKLRRECDAALRKLGAVMEKEEWENDPHLVSWCLWAFSSFDAGGNTLSRVRRVFVEGVNKWSPVHLAHGASALARMRVTGGVWVDIMPRLRGLGECSGVDVSRA
eukprot:Hpha_TRINITY_DN15798_c2_g3::TRINITY_DN15798_c2_g3_i2::g.40495::m.40495